MANFQKGLTWSRHKYAGYSSGGRKRYQIKNGYANTLAKGDPVKVSNGFIKIAVNGGVQAGSFDGCKYVDPNNLQTRESDIWISGTTQPSGTLIEGQSNPLGFYIPGADSYFIIPADASVSAGLLGATFPVSVGTASTLFHRSAAVMNVSVQVSADKNMVRVVGFPQRILTGPDQSPTLVEVEFVTTGYNQA